MTDFAWVRLLIWNVMPMTVTDCAACSVIFAAPDRLISERREDGGTFYCPNGHQLTFDGEIHKLKEVMKESTNLGMRTFDQSLFELYQSGEISYEDALRHADSTNEVRLKIKLSQGGNAHSLSQGLDGVELVES